MLQLTYISTAIAGMSQATVDEILAVSRRNNEALGITGLLLYDGYRFLQALEGEALDVNRTYARVKADPRHRAVVLLGTQIVRERGFGSWAMAAERVAMSTGATMTELVDMLTAHLTDATTRALFRGYARIRHAA